MDPLINIAEKVSLLVLGIGGQGQRLVSFLKDLNRSHTDLYLQPQEDNPEAFASYTRHLYSSYYELVTQKINTIALFQQKIDLATIFLLNTLNAEQECIIVIFDTDSFRTMTVSEFLSSQVSSLKTHPSTKSFVYVSEYIKAMNGALTKIAEQFGRAEKISQSVDIELARDIVAKIDEQFLLVINIHKSVVFNNMANNQLLQLTQILQYARDTLSLQVNDNKLYKWATSGQQDKPIVFNSNDYEDIGKIIMFEGNNKVSAMLGEYAPLFGLLHGSGSEDFSQLFQNLNLFSQGLGNFVKECKGFATYPGKDYAFIKQIFKDYAKIYETTQDPFLLKHLEATNWILLDPEEGRVSSKFELVHFPTDTTLDKVNYDYLQSMKKLLEDWGPSTHEQLTYYVYGDEGKLTNSALKALYNVQKKLLALIQRDLCLDDKDVDLLDIKHTRFRVKLLTFYLLAANHTGIDDVVKVMLKKYTNVESVEFSQSGYQVLIERTERGVSTQAQRYIEDINKQEFSLKNQRLYLELDEAANKVLRGQTGGASATQHSKVLAALMNAESNRFGGVDIVDPDSNDLFNLYAQYLYMIKNVYGEDNTKVNVKSVVNFLTQFFVRYTLLRKRNVLPSAPQLASMEANKESSSLSQPEPASVEANKKDSLSRPEAPTLENSAFGQNGSGSNNTHPAFLKQQEEMAEVVQALSLQQLLYQRQQSGGGEITFNQQELLKMVDLKEQKQLDVITFFMDVLDYEDYNFFTKQFTAAELNKSGPSPSKLTNQFDSLFTEYYKSLMIDDDRFNKYKAIGAWFLYVAITSDKRENDTIYADVGSLKHKDAYSPNVDIPQLFNTVLQNLKLYTTRFQAKASSVPMVNWFTKHKFSMSKASSTIVSVELEKVFQRPADYIIPMYFIRPYNDDNKTISEDIRKKLISIPYQEHSEDVALQAMEHMKDFVKTIMKTSEDSLPPLFTEGEHEHVKYINKLAQLNITDKKSPLGKIAELSKEITILFDQIDDTIARTNVIARFKGVPFIKKRDTVFYYLLLANEEECDLLNQINSLQKTKLLQLFKGKKISTISDVVTALNKAYNEIVKINIDYVKKNKTQKSILSNAMELYKVAIEKEENQSDKLFLELYVAVSSQQDVETILKDKLPIIHNVVKQFFSQPAYAKYKDVLTGDESILHSVIKSCAQFKPGEDVKQLTIIQAASKTVEPRAQGTQIEDNGNDQGQQTDKNIRNAAVGGAFDGLKSFFGQNSPTTSKDQIVTLNGLGELERLVQVPKQKLQLDNNTYTTLANGAIRNIIDYDPNVKKYYGNVIPNVASDKFVERTRELVELPQVAFVDEPITIQKPKAIDMVNFLPTSAPSILTQIEPLACVGEDCALPPPSQQPTPPPVQTTPLQQQPIPAKTTLLQQQPTPSPVQTTPLPQQQQQQPMVSADRSRAIRDIQVSSLADPERMEARNIYVNPVKIESSYNIERTPQMATQDFTMFKKDKSFKVSKRQKEVKRMQKYLKELDEFKIHLQTKNTKWLEDVNIYLNTINLELKSRLTKLGNQQTAPLIPGEEPRILRQVNIMYKRLLDMFEQKVNTNYSLTRKFFLKTHRHRLDALKYYILNNEYIVRNELREEYKNFPEALKSIQEQAMFYAEIRDKFSGYLKDIENINESYYDNLRNKLLKDVSLYGSALSGPQGIMVLDDEDRMAISTKYEDIDKVILQRKNKLKSLYIINYNIMDLIMDSQFFALYLIKGIRILFTYIALFLSTRVFSPIYESVVYDQKKPPPGLWKYMFIFLGLDLAFNIFLVVVLFLLQFLFKTPDNNFIIDKYLFYKYLTDYAISVITLFVIGVLIANVIVEKKYFKYKYEGLRAIRAFENIMFYTAIVVYMFPYFMIV